METILDYGLAATAIIWLVGFLIVGAIAIAEEVDYRNL